MVNMPPFSSLVSNAAIFSAGSSALPQVMGPADAAFATVYTATTGLLSGVSQPPPQQATDGIEQMLLGAAHLQFQDPELHARAVAIARREAQAIPPAILSNPDQLLERVRRTLSAASTASPTRTGSATNRTTLDFAPQTVDGEKVTTGRHKGLRAIWNPVDLNAHDRTNPLTFLSDAEIETLRAHEVVIRMSPYAGCRVKQIFIPQGNGDVLVRFCHFKRLELGLGESLKTAPVLRMDDHEAGLADYRRREVEALKQAIRRAVAGRLRGTIVIAGPSGAGKTYAIDQAKRELANPPRPSGLAKLFGQHGQASLSPAITVREYEVLTTLTRDAGDIDIMTIATLHPDDLPRMLKERGIEADTVVYFHPKPLNEKQTETARTAGISTEVLERDANTGESLFYTFFRSPIPEATTAVRMYTVTLQDSPILWALAAIRVRHPSLYDEGRLPLNLKGGYEHAARWFGRLRDILGVDDQELSNMITALLSAKDARVASRAYLGPQSAINGMRLILMAALERKSAGAMTITPLFSGRIANAGSSMRQLLDEIWPGAYQMPSFEQRDMIDLAVNGRIIDNLVGFLASVIDRDCLSEPERQALDFLLQPADSIG